MSMVNVLIEIASVNDAPFSMYSAGLTSESESLRQAERLVTALDGVSLEVDGNYAPVPMFVSDDLVGFASAEENDEVASQSMVVAAEVSTDNVRSLMSRSDLRVWPNSDMLFVGCPYCDRRESRGVDNGRSTSFDDAAEHPFDLARAVNRIDCRPYRPAVSLGIIRQLLGVEALWHDGFRGQNVIVAILDEGVNGDVYPVIGGYERNAAHPPGSASIQSHGSMCAADVLVAAPAARLYDYPFLGVPNSGGALSMFQAILEQRRRNGTPHVATNSYAFFGRPPRDLFPNHEIYTMEHPLHRKVREVIASGAAVFFAAGNCGGPCPDGRCAQSIIGEGSIVGTAALEEVITVAAVNSRHERIGYSGQGPGGFHRQKPDITAYSHFYGNYGPGRPAGGNGFDSGTSAACPVAAGVGAALLSARPGLPPKDLQRVLIESAYNIGSPGWDPLSGFGVINAAAAYQALRR